MINAKVLIYDSKSESMILIFMRNIIYRAMLPFHCYQWLMV